MSAPWKNPWGQSIDSQRADLWRVNLASARTIRDGGSISMLESLKATYSGMAPERDLADMSEEDFDFFPLSVAIPELRINPDAMPNYENLPTPMPGADEPVAPVRMTFRVETDRPGQVSKIVQILQCWRDAARAGRSTKFGTVPMLRAGGIFPPFRFDVIVRLYAGARLLSDRNFAYNRPLLIHPPSFTVVLQRAWVGTIGISELNYANNGEGVTVTANLLPANIRYNPSADELAEYQSAALGGVSFNSPPTGVPVSSNIPRSLTA